MIHTVGPVWQGGERGEPELLRSCYRNAFVLASAEGVRSLAFPAISTGVYGYPKVAAARIALEVMHQAIMDFDEIIACCFSQADADHYAELCADCIVGVES